VTVKMDNKVNRNYCRNLMDYFYSLSRYFGGVHVVECLLVLLICILVIVDIGYKNSVILARFSKLSDLSFTGSGFLVLLRTIYEIVVCWTGNNIVLCIYVYTERNIFGCSVT
jgi:hypothetical protein